MAEIRPFRGLRYNPEIVADPAQVLCPPYDIISPQDLRACLERHPFNVVRLELEGGAGGTDYSEVARTLREWQERRVMVPEESPVFYLHHHLFTFRGVECRRRGLVAAVGLGDGMVKPHEGTLPQPKEDRLRLLRATRTQISPVFLLYDDPQGQVEELFNAVEAVPPLWQAALGSEQHRLWRISAPELTARLRRLFQPLSLVIADGHHRFETALTYRQEMMATTGKGPGTEAYCFVMAILVAISDPGLLILPVHRLVRGLSPGQLRDLRDRLRQYFAVEERVLGSLPVAELEAGLQDTEGRVVLGVVGLEPGKWHRLTVKPDAPLPALGSQTCRNLDVNLLHQLLLKDYLGGAVTITYTPYTEVAFQSIGVRPGGQLGFLVNAISAEKIRQVALAGERLPGKSTYFYPKLPTGLMLFPVEGNL